MWLWRLEGNGGMGGCCVGSLASIERKDLKLECFVAVVSGLSRIEGVNAIEDGEATAAGCCLGA